jgi:hypothetical protein
LPLVTYRVRLPFDPLARIIHVGKMPSKVLILLQSRGVAQPGRAPGSGPGGRRFKSSLPDHLFLSPFQLFTLPFVLQFFSDFRYIRYN